MHFFVVKLVRARPHRRGAPGVFFILDVRGRMGKPGRAAGSSPLSRAETCLLDGLTW